MKQNNNQIQLKGRSSLQGEELSWRMPADGDVWSNERSSRTGQDCRGETGRQGPNLQRS